MPYNPGITYHGDQHIMAAGAALANGIREFRDQRRRSQAADATMEAIVQAAGVMKQQGMLPDEFANKLLEEAPKFPGLSTSKKEALVGAVAGNLTMLMKGMAEKEQMRQQRAHQDLMGDLAVRRDARDQADSEATAKWRNAQADALGKPPTFVTDPASGRTVVWHGNTMYPLPQAQGSQGPVTATPVVDASGKTIANAVPNGNGGFRVLPRVDGGTVQSKRLREKLELDRLALLQQRAQLQVESGSRWNPFGKSVAQEIADIDRQIGVIESQLEPEAPTSAAPKVQPQSPAAPAPAAKVDLAEEERRARAAIARGANAAEVARRFRERTGKDLM